MEPSAGMRAEFARVLPRVPVLAGTGEALPPPDGWADALVCGQAWHWVDPDRAVPEAARVLAPGGQLGLVWNFRDEAEPWVAELDGLLRARGEDRTDHRQLERLEPWFGPLEEHVVRWSHPVTEQQLVDMVASRSYVITMAADERERLLGEVRALVARARPTSLPYVTHCYRARRR
ncbi:class I SAM-dependent methyltransferase [Streptacidiphilus monticola]